MRSTGGPNAPTSSGPVVSPQRAAQELAKGRMIVVVDQLGPENFGVLVLGAQFVTPAAINFMTHHGRGLICLALSRARCDELGLDLMGERSESLYRAPFTRTIEAREGVSTGISVDDQAHTIRIAIDPTKGPDDLVVGGHVRPLMASTGGVLERPGPTEASIDLALLGDLLPAAVLCEIQNEDGSAARGEDLVSYCRRHELRMAVIEDLVDHRRRSERLITRIDASELDTAFGRFTAVRYRSPEDDARHVALVMGEVAGATDVALTVHVHCLAGNVFSGSACSCAQALDAALAEIAASTKGVLVYLGSDGLGAHARPYPDLHDDPVVTQVLGDLGVISVRTPTVGRA